MQLGMLQLDSVLHDVVRIVLPGVFNRQDANAVEPLLACFQVPLNTYVQQSVVLQATWDLVCCRQVLG